MNVKEAINQEVKPLNDYILIEYILSQTEVEALYPITPFGRLNLTEFEMQAWEAFNKEWTYEEALQQDVFYQILRDRLKNSNTFKGLIKDVSDKLKSTITIDPAKMSSSPVPAMTISSGFENWVNKEAWVDLRQAGTIPGLKLSLDAENHTIKALLHHSQIIAIMPFEPENPQVDTTDYILKNVSLTKDNVMLETPIPTVLKDQLDKTGARIIPHKDLFATGSDGNLSLELIRHMGTQNPLLRPDSYQAKVVKIADSVNNLDVDDVVIINNDYTFNINNAYHIDQERNTLYFIVSATTILAKYNNYFNDK